MATPEIRRSADPSPVGLSARERDALAELVTRKNSLVGRLENGSRQIEELRASGESVEQWETYWLGLLRQYEQVCDRLRERAERAQLRRAG